MKKFLGGLLSLIAVTAQAQQTIPLYHGAIPNSIDGPDRERVSLDGEILLIDRISRPTLTVFLPENREKPGPAVIICPGGGYWVNAIDHEGFDVAIELNKKGVAAFVLKYRIPDAMTMIDREIGALQDVQQAVKLVRDHATEYNLDPNKIGVLGFSAGGHLASTAGTHFTKPLIPNDSKTSLRPDFMILIYPVISFADSITHMGSRDQIVGKNPSREKVAYYSNEMQITKDTPPTFLIHATDDTLVKPENSIYFYLGLLKHGVPAEIHIYEKGGHGFGLNNKSTKDRWFDRCVEWLRSAKWLSE